ncbi:hypothetical protein SB96558_1961 [Shigella boydii 965-58]|nr:hypothetical protein SB96558_1961 [Shigella boydii 965-58]
MQHSDARHNNAINGHSSLANRVRMIIKNSKNAHRQTNIFV